MRFVSKPRNFERACLKSAAAFVFAMACTVAILALAVVARREPSKPTIGCRSPRTN